MDSKKYNQPILEPNLIKCPNVECWKFKDEMKLVVQNGTPKHIPFKRGDKYDC